MGEGSQVEGVESRQTILLARGTRTIRMCSFDARNRGSTRLPLKVKRGIGMTRAVEDQSAPIPEEITNELGGINCNLARRPQWDQHGCHSKREREREASELGRIIWKDERRPMRAVKNKPAPPQVLQFNIAESVHARPWGKSYE